MPQESVLGPAQFKTFVSDLEETMECTLLLSTADIKLGSIYPKARLPYKGTQAGYRDGPAGTLGNSTRTSAESCPFNGPTSWQGTGWGPLGWGAALRESPWRWNEQQAGYEATACSGSNDGQLHPDCMNRSSQQIEGSDYSPLLSIC